MVLCIVMRCFQGEAMKASFAQNVHNTKGHAFKCTEKYRGQCAVLFQKHRPKALSDETEGPNAPGNSIYFVTALYHDIEGTLFEMLEA